MTADPTPPKPHAAQPNLLALRVPLQLFLAAGWFRSGAEKLVDTKWWGGDTLERFLEEQQPLALPFFNSFANGVLMPLSAVVACFVAVLEFGVVASLVTNRLLKPALWSAILLNVFLTMAGRVNPSAFYIVMQVALLFAVSRPTTLDVARRRAALWCVPAVLLLPFARTIHPEQVKGDPALMLSFVAMIAAVTTLALAQPAFDLRQTFATVRQRRRVRAVRNHPAGVIRPSRWNGGALPDSDPGLAGGLTRRSS